MRHRSVTAISCHNGRSTRLGPTVKIVEKEPMNATGVGTILSRGQTNLHTTFGEGGGRLIVVILGMTHPLCIHGSVGLNSYTMVPPRLNNYQLFSTFSQRANA